MQRRELLKFGSGAALYSALVGLGVVTPSLVSAAEWNEAAFNAKTLQEAFKTLGVAAPADSKDVAINAPDIAENGAVVPVGVATTLAKVEQIAVLVEKNPSPLAAHYALTDASVADVSMRVKMGQSSDVVALVKADGKWYSARKEVKVTLGGCGG